jgi:hypothetical protein
VKKFHKLAFHVIARNELSQLRLNPEKSRVAHTLFLMYAPHQHVQRVSRRVLSVARSGFLRVADIKGDVGATRKKKAF